LFNTKAQNRRARYCVPIRCDGKSTTRNSVPYNNTSCLRTFVFI
jgi:hypothetical protein